MGARKFHEDSDTRLFEVEIWCIDELKKFCNDCPFVMQSRNGPIHFLLMLLKLEQKSIIDYLLYDIMSSKTDYQIAKFNVQLQAGDLPRSPDLTKKELNRLINGYLAVAYSDKPCNKELLLMNPPKSAIDKFLLKNGPKASSICTSLRLDVAQREAVRLQGRWEPFLDLVRQLLAILASGQNARVIPVKSVEAESTINYVLDLQSRGIPITIIADSDVDIDY